jgi:hypothetical protein
LKYLYAAFRMGTEMPCTTMEKKTSQYTTVSC